MSSARRTLAPALAAVAVAVLAGVGLTGCGASAAAPSIDSAAAAERYEPVMAELLGALGDAYPAVTWTLDGETRVSTDGEGCVFVVGTQRGEPSLPETAGDWAAAAEVVDPVLAARGFGETSDGQEFDGGWTGITASDDTGARLRLSDKGYTLMQLSVPVTDSTC